MEGSPLAAKGILMSLPRDLDEYSLSELTAEIARRDRMWTYGWCDYCKRPLQSEPSCKFPERHNKMPPCRYGRPPKDCYHCKTQKES